VCVHCRPQMMVSMCKALGEFAQQNHVAAYDALVSAGPHFLKLFKAADSPWVIDPLYTMVRNLHVLAERADAELQAQGKSIGKMSDAGSQLMKYFRESLQGAGHRCEARQASMQPYVPSKSLAEARKKPSWDRQ